MRFGQSCCRTSAASAAESGCRPGIPAARTETAGRSWPAHRAARAPGTARRSGASHETATSPGARPPARRRSRPRRRARARSSGSGSRPASKIPSSTDSGRARSASPIARKRYCNVRSVTLMTLGTPVVPDDSTSRQTSSGWRNRSPARGVTPGGGVSQSLLTSTSLNLLSGRLVAVAEQPVDLELRLLGQMRGLQRQRRDAAAVQRQDQHEMQQRMADFERDDLALVQAGLQHVLRGGVDALHQPAIGRHAAGKDHRRLVGAELGLELNVLEPVHAEPLGARAAMVRRLPTCHCRVAAYHRGGWKR